MLLRKYLLSERLKHHPFVVIWEAELPALSRLQWLVVGLLTYGEVAVTPPVTVVVVVAVNPVSTRSNFGFWKHKLVVTSLVLQRLVCKSFLVCHYLVRDVHWRRASWWPTMIWTPYWLTSWLYALRSSHFWGATPAHRQGWNILR